MQNIENNIWVHFAIYSIAPNYDACVDFQGHPFQIQLNAFSKSKICQKMNIFVPKEDDTICCSLSEEFNFWLQQIHKIQTSLISRLRVATYDCDKDFEWQGKWYKQTKSQASQVFYWTNLIKEMLEYALGREVMFEISLIQSAD
jgi:hypothetical protein